ncbi:MAG: hypothetical protein LC799_23250 [Actinobacteria bacterium]|nr:hypothetical protein [Actinomycetota bacterium]
MTCATCGEPITHQPEWPDVPDARQVLVCRKCGYAAAGDTDWNGNPYPTTIYLSPDGSRVEAGRPSNLALKMLIGEDVVEDYPPEYCAVPGCRERADAWIRSVPLCALHHYQRWYPSFTDEGEPRFEVWGPPQP